MLSFDSDKLTRVALQSKGPDVEFGKNGSNEWQILKPRPLRAEGTQVDTVSTAAGQIVTKSYTVTVSAGQLDLSLQDQGGSDPNVVIEALDVVRNAADTQGPRVVVASPSGTLAGPVDRVTLTFNKPIQAGSVYSGAWRLSVAVIVKIGRD